MIRFLIGWLNAWRARGDVRGSASWRRPWDAPAVADGLTLLAAAVDRGVDCWAAREPGECCSCGHEWIAGEIIGSVYQQYRRESDGSVTYDPAVRRVCCVCVEQSRVEGDLSLLWVGGLTVGGCDPVRERMRRGGYNPHDVVGER